MPIIGTNRGRESFKLRVLAAFSSAQFGFRSVQRTSEGEGRDSVFTSN